MWRVIDADGEVREQSRERARGNGLRQGVSGLRRSDWAAYAGSATGANFGVASSIDLASHAYEFIVQPPGLPGTTFYVSVLLGRGTPAYLNAHVLGGSDGPRGRRELLGITLPFVLRAQHSHPLENRQILFGLYQGR